MSFRKYNLLASTTMPVAVTASEEFTLEVPANFKLEPPASLLRIVSLVRSPRLLPMAAAAVWEVQSYLATVVLYGLLVFSSLWVTFPVMLGWAAVATVVFFYGRKRGLPDLLASGPVRCGNRLGLLGNISLLAGRVWLVGIQAFVYSRTLGRVLNRPASCRSSRLARSFVLGTGLTLFGVTAAHHMLSRAGYEGGRLLRLGLIGSVCNVTYRVLLSAAVVSAVSQVLALLTVWRWI